MKRDLVLFVSFFAIVACHNVEAQQLGWTSGGMNVATNSNYGSYFISDVKTYATNNMNICPDGAGGIVLSWMTLPSGGSYFNTYANRISCQGTLLWAPAGVGDLMSTYTNAASGSSWCYGQTVSDGAGGAYVGYIEIDQTNTNSTTNRVPYIQHVNASGVALWGTQGYRLPPTTETAVGNYYIASMQPDGSGGVLVVYCTYTASGGSIATSTVRAARLSGTGSTPTFSWGTAANGGVTVQSFSSGSETYTTNDISPVLCADGTTGNAIVAWQTELSGVYYNHIAKLSASSGSIMWNNTYSAGGNSGSYCTGDNGFQIVSNSTTGAASGATLLFNNSASNVMYLLSVNASGGAVYGPTLVQSLNASLTNEYYGRLAADGNGGVYVTNYDAKYTGEMLTHFNSSGSETFPSTINDGFLNGVYLAGSSSATPPPNAWYYSSVIADNAGNAICAWAQGNTVYIQKYNQSTGATMWSQPGTYNGAGGIQVGTNYAGSTNIYDAGSYSGPILLSDGSNGAYVAWSTNASPNQIAVQHIVDTSLAPKTQSAITAGGTKINMGSARVGVQVTAINAATISNTGIGYSVVFNSSSSEFGTSTIIAPAIPDTIKAGKSVQVSLSAIAPKNGTYNDTLIFTANDSVACGETYSSVIRIPVTGIGTYPHLSGSGTITTMPTTKVGGTSTTTIPIQNTGTDTLHVTGASLTISGGVASYTLISPPTAISPLVIPPNNSANISAKFSAASTAIASAIMSVTSDDSQYVYNSTPAQYFITGSGVYPHLTATTNNVNFATVIVFQDTTKSAWSVSNTGTDTLWIYPTSSITGANAGDFSFDTSVHLPMAILPGKSGTFIMRFAPQGLGNRAGILNIVSNFDSVLSGFTEVYSTAPFTVTLNGTGGTGAPAFGFSALLLPAPTHIGQADTTQFTFTNLPAGLSALMINQMTLSGLDVGDFELLNSNYIPLTSTFTDSIPVGKSHTYYVRFAPLQVGTRIANLHIISNASNGALDVPIISTGNKAQISATSLAFGNVALNACDTLAIALNNTGGSSTTVTSLNLSGQFVSSYTVLNPISGQGTFMQSGQTLYYRIVFCPSTAGAENVIARFLDSDGDTAYASITGTGASTAAWSNANKVLFLSTQINSSDTAYIYVTNTGQVNGLLSGTAFSGQNATDFSSYAAFPMTVAAGDSVLIPITFSPSSAGMRTATMTIKSPQGNLTISVNGGAYTMPFTVQPSASVMFNSMFNGNFNPSNYYDTTIYLRDYLSSSASLINASINPVLSGNWYAFTIVYPLTYPHLINAYPSTGDSIVVQFQPGVAQTAYQAMLTIQAQFGSTDTTISIPLNGNASPSEIREDGAIPADISLAQNFPNPFGALSTITYSLPTEANVSLAVYDIMGRNVETLVSGEHSPGTFAVTFDGTALPAGVYYYELRANNTIIHRIMELVR